MTGIVKKKVRENKDAKEAEYEKLFYQESEIGFIMYRCN
jgi:hypothetical protein